ncbi:MAG: phosphate acyltransferase PlsX [Actinobacteria bacterium]|nr:phosphate acyltransferase PlsX [Actinomycetota bacterium]MCL6104231.1 phosphate acyltransferase PlsX [Actinomycetota bacterium]
MSTLPVAVDAMGGDNAPDAVVAGAKVAATEMGIPVALVGPTDIIGPLLSDGVAGIEILPATEVIGMDEDPVIGVRNKKDATLVKAAEAVRDARSSAMVSAGNTGACLASALFRMGRLHGVSRPGIAVPIPIPGSAPTILIDAGASVECSPAMLVQFAEMGSVLSNVRYSVPKPKVAILTIGEEPGKGTPSVKAAYDLLSKIPDLNFIGNVEGRDLLKGVADVVVTDGFTGNVVLKTLEGALKFFMSQLMGVMDLNEQTKDAAKVLLPFLAPLADELDPESTGGAMLLGVDGVCIISHGSSSARAIANAIQVAYKLAQTRLMNRLSEAIK